MHSAGSLLLLSSPCPHCHKSPSSSLWLCLPAWLTCPAEGFRGLCVRDAAFWALVTHARAGVVALEGRTGSSSGGALTVMAWHKTMEWGEQLLLSLIFAGAETQHCCYQASRYA